MLQITGMYGLLLIPDSGNTNAIFRRVGLFHLSSNKYVFGNVVAIDII
jgi:hypothetical protein